MTRTKTRERKARCGGKSSVVDYCGVFAAEFGEGRDNWRLQPRREAKRMYEAEPRGTDVQTTGLHFHFTSSQRFRTTVEPVKWTG
ncbi:hypothetical protein PDE_03625 [Penicillium oxalicum 114-2]|uniref:Uncharacterized protein n=1 Tax=Penicillium oxalicum (strain 114-2 / CGMCC 5302) TaxID=933388 RepID=S7ZEG8_PENO1|nr:hypothetical protein PDE_03625 [Penicillium oxalicum 114-2]